MHPLKTWKSASRTRVGIGCPGGLCHAASPGSRQARIFAQEVVEELDETVDETDDEVIKGNEITENTIRDVTNEITKLENQLLILVGMKSVNLSAREKSRFWERLS